MLRHQEIRPAVTAMRVFKILVAVMAFFGVGRAMPGAATGYTIRRGYL
jgi:hypothetical protein